MENVYRKIKQIRELKGFKQDDLANHLGLVRSSYNKIENGKTALTIENLQKIADFLGVSVKEILFGDEQSSQSDSEKDKRIREQEKDLENTVKFFKDFVNTLMNNLFNTIIPFVLSNDLDNLDSITINNENVNKGFEAFEKFNSILENTDDIPNEFNKAINLFFKYFTGYDLDILFTRGIVTDRKFYKMYIRYKKIAKEESEKLAASISKLMD